MPTPEFIASLEDLGGLGLFLFLIGLIGIGLWRKWWAPGWMLDDAVKRCSAAEEENLALAASVSKLTIETKALRAALNRERAARRDPGNHA